MTQLYIDGLLCELPTDFSFTLVKENVYFSEASSYTFEVKLPVIGTVNNQRIFGSITRIDARKQVKSYPCRLIVDNKVILDGTATITSVDQTYVSVQLLGGNSELNFTSKTQELYIDELNIGTIDDFGVHRQSDGTYKFDFDNSFSGLIDYVARLPYNRGFKMCPIVNSTTGELMNPLVFKGTSIRAEYTVHPTDVHWGVKTGNGFQYEIRRIAVQPKLREIVDRIFSAIGYNIGDNELTHSNMYIYAYVGNSSEVVQLSEMLPHWTISEFIEELKKMFACVIEINEQDKTVHIYKRSRYYSEDSHRSVARIQISDVLDEYSASIDSEEQFDKYSGRFGFDISYPDYANDYLGESFDVYKKSGKLIEVGQGLHPTGTWSCTHKIATDAIGVPIFESLYCDTLQNNCEIGEEKESLRILPLAPADETIYFPTWEQTGEYWIKDGNMGCTRSDNIVAAAGLSGEYSDEDLYEIIEDREEPSSRERLDNLYVGFYHPDNILLSVVLNNIDQIFLYSAYKSRQDGVKYRELTLTERYYNDNGIYLPTPNLNYEFYREIKSIKTNIEHTFKFVHDGSVLDPQNIFVMRNKLYVCKELEFQIGERGFNKIVTGKFYEL